MYIVVCDEGALRLMGEGSNAYAETCILDNWVPLYTNPQASSNVGDPFGINLEGSYDSISVNWDSAGTIHEVTCTEGTLTLTALVMTGNSVNITPLQASTNYTCCVLRLTSSSNGVYTVSGSVCDDVLTSAPPVLSTLEIALVAVAGALALIIAVIFIGCCLLACRHKKGR